MPQKSRFTPRSTNSSLWQTPDAVAEALRDVTRKVMGSIIVAEEGINGVMAGSAAELTAAEQALQHDPRFHGAFTDMVFKRSPCRTRPFSR